MFQIIQAGCHAVEKVTQTAFSFFLSDTLFAAKQVSTDGDVTKHLPSKQLE